MRLASACATSKTYNFRSVKDREIGAWNNPREPGESSFPHGSASTRWAKLWGPDEKSSIVVVPTKLTRYVVQQFVFIAIHNSRSDDGGIREGLSDTLLSFCFTPIEPG
jgi:hypothetical protein